MQLMMLNDFCKEKSVPNIAALADVLAKAQPETRRVFNEVEMLISQCLSLPIRAFILRFTSPKNVAAQHDVTSAANDNLF